MCSLLFFEAGREFILLTPVCRNTHDNPVDVSEFETKSMGSQWKPTGQRLQAGEDNMLSPGALSGGFCACC